MQVFRRGAVNGWMCNAISEGFQEDAELFVWVTSWCLFHAHQRCRFKAVFPKCTQLSMSTLYSFASFPVMYVPFYLKNRWVISIKTVVFKLWWILELLEALTKISVPMLCPRLIKSESLNVGPRPASVSCETDCKGYLNLRTRAFGDL